MAQQTMPQTQREIQAKGEVTYKTIRYIEHREEMLAYQKKYHEENHDAFIQYQKAYYQRTKEAKKERYNVLVHCDCCKKDVRRGAIANHRKTKKHIRNEEAHNEKAHAEPAKSKTVDGNEEVDGEVIVYMPYSKCALQIEDDETDGEVIVYAQLKRE